MYKYIHKFIVSDDELIFVSILVAHDDAEIDVHLRTLQGPAHTAHELLRCEGPAVQAHDHIAESISRPSIPESKYPELYQVACLS